MGFKSKIFFIRLSISSFSHFHFRPFFILILFFTKTLFAATAPSPCLAIVTALPKSAPNLSLYSSALACLEKENGEKKVSIKDTSDKLDSIFSARLPSDRNLYLMSLENMQLHPEIKNPGSIFRLAEIKFPHDPIIQNQIAEVFKAQGNFYLAIWSYLKLVESDSSQYNMAQYQIGEILRNPDLDPSADQVYDSLAESFQAKRQASAKILEAWAWNFQNYKQAEKYQGFFKDPAFLFERIVRFQNLGYFDYAAATLEKISWKNLPQPLFGKARLIFLQVNFGLKNYSAIVNESNRTNANNGTKDWDKNNEEENYLLAYAYLKLGQGEKTLGMIESMTSGKPRLFSNSPSPWKYSFQILKAQALIALGKNSEAGKILTGLKKDPERREGTGPILFWQSWLAISQNHWVEAESLLVLSSAYTGTEEAQRSLEFRFFLLQDTSANRSHFFKGLTESSKPAKDRIQELDSVSKTSALWPFSSLEKAQILVQQGQIDRAEAVLDHLSKNSPDKLAGFQAEAKAAFLLEKQPGGRQAALVRYENLVVQYQQGVIPAFTRGRIKALK